MGEETRMEEENESGFGRKERRMEEENGFDFGREEKGMEEKNGFGFGREEMEMERGSRNGERVWFRKRANGFKREGMGLRRFRIGGRGMGKGAGLSEEP